MPEMSSNASQARKKRPAKKPTQIATVIESAAEGQKRSASSVDQKILDKIQKCLVRAYHSNSSEKEAKAALFVSQKLMSQHNVTQADIIASDSAISKAHFGGRSKVSITKASGSSKKIISEAFVGKIARAMSTFFDCKSYSTNFRTHIHWVFFGIASNTAAAAMAFEMAHNKILEWACEYKGGTPTFSYRLGVGDGLVAMANREKQKELEDAKRKELDIMSAREREEAEERQRQLDRLQIMSPASADSDSSSEEDADPVPFNPDSDMPDLDPESDDDLNENLGFSIQADFNTDDAQIIDLCDDIDESIEKFVKPEISEPQNPIQEIPEFSPKPEPSIKPEPELGSIPAVSPWESGMQLTQFRATSMQIADDYLKQKNIKLGKGRKRRSTIRNLDAYRQGQKDSAKIELQHASA